MNLTTTDTHDPATILLSSAVLSPSDGFTELWSYPSEPTDSQPLKLEPMYRAINLGPFTAAALTLSEIDEMIKELIEANTAYLSRFE